jgi:putative FmdB family regulatory protein
MPIYEFKCRKCDSLFEILFRSSNEKTEASCPSCKSKKVDRQMSVFGGKIGNTSSGSGAGCSTCSATTCSTA